MTIHTSFYKGKKVFLILKDGRAIVDRFMDKRNGGLVLENYGFVKHRDIRCSTVCKAR